MGRDSRYHPAMNEWLFGVIGFLAGAAMTVIVLLIRHQRGIQHLRDDAAGARSRAAMLEEQAVGVRSELEAARAQGADAERRREAAERERATITEQLRARQQQFEEQKRLLEEAEKRLADTFTALGTTALQANNRQFLELAQKTFEKLLSDAKGDVEKKQQAIDQLVKPIRELLEKQNLAVGEIEKKRDVAYKGLEEQLRFVAESHQRLNLETSRLVSALRRPEQRGRWGEMQLRNTVELAGMSAHCDFIEQPTTRTDDGGQQRPDMVIRLPGGGSIVVDSKVTLDAYLTALDPDADRAALMAQHARQVENHYKGLSSKQYWSQFERAPKLVVMFMPLESALMAALEQKPDLHADAMRNHVLLATPTLLVALLRAIAYGWQQEDVAANARQIADVGRELYERLTTFTGHFEKVGKGLENAARSYNSAIGSLESRVLVSARRLKDLHATTERDIEVPNRLEQEIRPITAADLLADDASSDGDGPSP